MLRILAIGFPTFHILTACCAVLGQSGEHSKKDVLEWVYVHPKSDGQLIVWEVNDTKFGLINDLGAGVAADPVRKDLSLSLVHAGYSEKDPDGKNAVLTVTVVLKKRDVSDDLKQLIKSERIIVDSAISLPDSQKWVIDVELPDDPKEEARIRSTLGLPRKIGIQEAAQPLSIRWTNVKGATLHKWLSDKTAGLQIRLSPEMAKDKGSSLSFKKTYHARVAPDSLKDWWKKHSVDTSKDLRWRGGLGPLIQRLLASGVIERDGAPIPISSADREYAALHSRLASIVKQEKGGVYSISYDDVLETTKDLPATSIQFGADIDLAMRLSPGSFLLEKPQLVKDLTGTSNGIDVLAKDK